MTNNSTQLGRQLWFRVLVFCLFLIGNSLLAGYLAITFKFPSLYNVSASFTEYAIPLPFYWGFMHIPFMLLYGIPLLVIHKANEKFTAYFRLFCISSFLVLLMLFQHKVPFLLFPTVDAITALLYSLILLPPRKETSPKLTALLKLSAVSILMLIGYFVYSLWIHQTPVVSKNQYVNGIFTLQSIEVKNDFHKELLFFVDLKNKLPENQVCEKAQLMANEMIQDYPFDDAYSQLINFRFNPTKHEQTIAPYALGELSLNAHDKTPDGRFACYIAYKE